MTAEELKEAWIKAYEITLNEYVIGTHRANWSTCAKCNLVIIDLEKTITETPNCNYCLENRFYLYESHHQYPCTLRKCEPKNSEVLIDNGIQHKALMLYHNKAIAYLKTVLPITFERNIEVIQRHLREIDESVYLEIAGKATV